MAQRFLLGIAVKIPGETVEGENVFVNKSVGSQVFRGPWRWRGLTNQAENGRYAGTSVDKGRAVEKSRLMRAVVLLFSFLPFLYYAAKDTMFHFRGRKVTTTEHILHGAIGMVLVILFSHALMAHHLVVLSALLLFIVAGGIDEYIFHRDIPAEESNLHAKEHLALLIFLVMSLATDALEKNHWSILQTFAPLRGASGGTL